MDVRFVSNLTVGLGLILSCVPFRIRFTLTPLCISLKTPTALLALQLFSVSACLATSSPLTLLNVNLLARPVGSFPIRQSKVINLAGV